MNESVKLSNKYTVKLTYLNQDTGKTYNEFYNHINELGLIEDTGNLNINVQYNSIVYSHKGSYLQLVSNIKGKEDTVYRSVKNIVSLDNKIVNIQLIAKGKEKEANEEDLTKFINKLMPYLYTDVDKDSLLTDLQSPESGSNAS